MQDRAHLIRPTSDQPRDLLSVAPFVAKMRQILHHETKRPQRHHELDKFAIKVFPRRDGVLLCLAETVNTRSTQAREARAGRTPDDDINARDGEFVVYQIANSRSG